MAQALPRDGGSASPSVILYSAEPRSDLVVELLHSRLHAETQTAARWDTLTTLLEEHPLAPLVVQLGQDEEEPIDVVRRAAARTDVRTVVALGPSGDVRSAILAIQAGASAYYTADELDGLVACLKDAAARSPEQPVDVSPFCSTFVTGDPAIKALFRVGAIIARSGCPVLITGGTGVGKEVFARALHAASGRSGRFVVENVAGLDDTLFSDVLFGHVRGAFTDATADRAGMVQRAQGGTLLLDEIGDLSRASQVKLLRLVEDGGYYAVGADSSSESLARLIVATNRDVLQAVRSGTFRLDLYFRLAAYHIHIPPLRARAGDIPLLAAHFIAAAAADLGIEPPALTPRLTAILESHDYPGNVRELQSVVSALVSHSRDRRLSGETLQEIARSLVSHSRMVAAWAEPQVTFPETLPSVDELTDQLIDEALRRTEGNQSAAARMLGLTASAVSKRLQRRRGSTGA